MRYRYGTSQTVKKASQGIFDKIRGTVMVPLLLYVGIEETDALCTFGKSMMPGIGQQSIFSNPIDNDLTIQTAANKEFAVR